ncbi:MAG TPA: hypothetical protein PKK06_11345 [Phycisphaerae bacterium]|nr:hypothetical protein [Phycisphaerae bacterium]HNU45835.1 hypothetical protein [Phycisphaerae bacterium]
MTHKPSPDVLALILCDQIITDRITGKQSLIGMFSRIHALRFPAGHPQLCVFVALTDGHGRNDLMLRIVDSNEERKPLIEGKGVVEFKDPRAIANLALQFHGLVFPQSGEYRVQLYCNGSLLREARLELVLAQPRPTRPPTGEPGMPPGPEFPGEPPPGEPPPF